MESQVVVIGASPDIVAHIAGKGVGLLQVQARSFQSLNDFSNVGCFVLQWSAAGSDCLRIASLFQAVPKSQKVPPLYIIHSHRPDKSLDLISKDAKIAGIFFTPNELFKLDMAVHAAAFPEDDDDTSSVTQKQASANPYKPQKKYSVSEALSRCANAILATKPIPETSDQKVYFFCESTELLKQAKDAFTRLGTPQTTFFSAPDMLVESVMNDSPHQLIVFADAPSKAVMTVLEKIGLNRKLPAFGIQVLFPGEQSRTNFLRAANAVLFDRVMISALTPKDLRAALDELKGTHDNETPRAVLKSLRAIINDPAAAAGAIEDKIAVLGKFPGKERWAARESFFAHMAQGQLEAGIAAFKKYQKEHPCDLDMWLELKTAAQKQGLGVEQCIDGAIRVIAMTGFATESEHRQLIKALEDQGDAAAIKKYIEARGSEALQQPDTAMKLAFAAFAGAVNDTAGELQWVLDLLWQAPTDPRLILRCGRVLAKSGDFDGAARAFGFGAQAAPGKRLVFELKQVESLIGGNRMMKAEEKIRVLQREFPADPRIDRLAKKIGQHFAAVGSGAKLMAVSE